MPGAFCNNSCCGVPNVPMSMPVVQGIRENVPIYEYDYYLRGVTRDAAGAVLGSCAVVLYRTLDNSVAALITSDGSGNFSIQASAGINHYLVAYKPGSPDVAGTTVNTLVGSPQ